MTLRDVLGDIPLLLDHPQAEGLAHGHEGILLPNELGEVGFCLLVPGIPGHDPVHQGIAVEVLAVVPSSEFLRQSPQGNVLVHAALQFVGVVVDQFHRQEVHPRKSRLEPAIEELGDLGGEGDGLKALRGIGIMEADARLGGVGDDQFQVGVGCQSVIALRVQEGIDHLAEGGDLIHVLHRLTVLGAPEHNVVTVVLAAEGLQVFAGDGGDGGDVHLHAFGFQGVKISVHKGAEKIALSVLQYFYHEGTS
ncbi:unknown [Clostridium sp. CAG:1013]|nr:unknown [Clostridium sp. CAG:1013]